MDTLPVYGVSTLPQLSPERLNDLGEKIFGIEHYSLEEKDGHRLVRTKSEFMDVNDKGGAIWAADQTELWNPVARPELPNKQKANEIASKFVKKNSMLPTEIEKDRFVVEQLDVASSYVSFLDKDTGEREDHKLDYRVPYGVSMIIEDPETGSKIHAPVISGGFKFGVTIGDTGKIIAYNGAWKPIGDVETHATYIPRKTADQHFKKLTSRLNIESFDAELAYAYTQSSTKQAYLYPVWAYRAMGNINGNKFPLRIITLPATDIGPQPQPIEPQPPRSELKIPRSWEPISKKNDLLVLDPYEAATSWIGPIGGLGGSNKNAQGFVDGLKNAGWKINFNFGDCNAWETDWHENDDYYVDAVDFVFYTGHAGVDGWMLVNPSNCNSDYLASQEVGAAPETPGDIWGRQDLEWIIIAACGPLEDNILASGGGNVLQRWDGAFDGLHILMGYGSVTFDNEDEGRKVIQYARQGQTLINAWFRTAQEVQPSTNGLGAPYGPTVYVGAMYASKSGQTSPYNDHLWGYGSVANDPTPPNGFTCMWVPC